MGGVGVGLAAGPVLYPPAAAGTAFLLLIQAGMRPIEARFFKHEAQRQRLLIETTNTPALLAEVPHLSAHHQMRVQSMQFERDSSAESDIVELTVRLDHLDERFAVMSDLQTSTGVLRVHDGFGPAVLKRMGRRGIGFPDVSTKMTMRTGTAPDEAVPSIRRRRPGCVADVASGYLVELLLALLRAE